MPLGRAFIGAFVLAAVGLNVYAFATREPKPTAVARPSVAHELLDRVSVRDQLTVADISAIKSAGFQTIIDLRPDGEAPDQVPSAVVSAGAQALGLQFAYVPTPHGDIPAAVVDQLSRHLAEAPRPILLYCRSGNRAARAWALAEASRAGGAPGEGIATAVVKAGQKVDDLRPQIASRIAARTPKAAEEASK